MFAAVFGSVPLLQHLASYEFGLVWGLAAPLIMSTVLHVNTPIKMGSSSRKQTTDNSAGSSVGSGKRDNGSKPSALHLSPVAPDASASSTSRLEPGYGSAFGGASVTEVGA